MKLEQWVDQMTKTVVSFEQSENALPFLLTIIFPTASFAGLANLIRSDKPLTKRLIASAMLNSGLFGVAIAALMRHRYGVEFDLLTIGVSILSGLGGNALLDFVIETLKAAIKKKAEQ